MHGTSTIVCLGAGGRPELPSLAPVAPAETLASYSARALRFLLSTSCCTAVLTSDQLEWADMAAYRAIAALPGTLTAADAIVARRLTDVRHAIASVLAFRRSAVAVPTAGRVNDPPRWPADEADREDGRPAPLVPPPIAPAPATHAPMPAALVRPRDPFDVRPARIPTVTW